MSTVTDSLKTEIASRNRPLAAHVPAHADDPLVRRAGERSVHARADAGPGAPVYRRRSRGRGRMRSAAAGRLHHQHASRARALRGEGSRAGPDVRRAAGQGSRLLQRQGRLDAHCRSGHGQPGRKRDCRGEHGHRHGRGVYGEAAGHGASRGVLLRRGRAWARECSTK